jgi:hypothetical protein
MYVDGHPSRGRPKQRMDRVKDDMRIKGVSMEMTSDRREWKKKSCCADSTYCDVCIYVFIFKCYYVTIT